MCIFYPISKNLIHYIFAYSGPKGEMGHSGNKGLDGDKGKESYCLRAK